MPPQFDDRGQLAFLVEGTTNRLGGNFGNRGKTPGQRVFQAG